MHAFINACIFADPLHTMCLLNVLFSTINFVVLDEFSGLLSEEKCSVEDFALWVDDIIEKCFKKVHNKIIVGSLAVSTEYVCTVIP